MYTGSQQRRLKEIQGAFQAPKPFSKFGYENMMTEFSTTLASPEFQQVE